ncbi:MAG TPA: hypothetical protein VFZ65_01725 [Planctomycetota bacterium]|nr:hypothetical protein [Planctomycetota bacterium]
MVESAGFPIDALAQPVASIGEHGALSPCNDAMRRLMALFGGAAGPCRSLQGLGLDGDASERLAAGEPVDASAGGAHFELQRVATGNGSWLLAEDVTHRERLAASQLAASRARSLAASAASIVHDLTNLLGAGLGLAAVLRPSQRDAADQLVLDELTRGTQQAAALLRALASHLQQAVPHAVVEPGAFVDDAVAIVGKAAIRHGVGVSMHREPELPRVRVVASEAAQVVREALLFLIEGKPVAVHVGVGPTHAAIAGSRSRRCLRVRLEGSACHAGCVAEAEHIATLAPGLSALLGRSEPPAARLVAGLLALRRAGGDLRIEFPDGRLRLDLLWPAARGTKAADMLPAAE